MYDVSQVLLGAHRVLYWYELTVMNSQNFSFKCPLSELILRVIGQIKLGKWILNCELENRFYCPIIYLN